MFRHLFPGAAILSELVATLGIGLGKLGFIGAGFKSISDHPHSADLRLKRSLNIGEFKKINHICFRVIKTKNDTFIGILSYISIEVRMLANRTDKLLGMFGQNGTRDAGLTFTNSFATIVSTTGHCFAKYKLERMGDALGCALQVLCKCGIPR